MIQAKARNSQRDKRPDTTTRHVKQTYVVPGPAIEDAEFWLAEERQEESLLALTVI